MDGSLRFSLRLAYLGTGFAGWQRQVGARTVQGTLEAALAALFGTPIRTAAAGRTDAGVHAAGQVVHFDAPLPIPPDGLVAALNTRLPPDLRVLAARRVAPTFDARRHACGKHYCYRLAWGVVLPPWQAQRTWVLPSRPDLDRVAAALAALTGTHDFAAFARSGHAGTGRRGTVRCLSLAQLRWRGRRAAIHLVGDGFLRGMARRIVGAVLEVGRGAQEVDWLAALLAAPTTHPPAPTAPAHGLTLERVHYRRTDPPLAPQRPC